MDLNKYSDLREKIQNQDFETKNKDIDKWLFIFSYLGNIGSIFFAFFLVYPALLKTIGMHMVTGGSSTIIAGFITVIILSGFELLKRKVFANFVFDMIKAKLKLNRAAWGWLIFTISLLASSFYFSLNGAMDFAKTSEKRNEIIISNTNRTIDSLVLVYNSRKEELLKDNAQYRESNAKYRENIASSPINYRTVRLEYQQMIDANQKAIDLNEKRIKEIDAELNNEIDKLNKQLQDTTSKNESDDISNIYLFLILSTSIELIIIIGVFFRKYYEYNIFLESMSQMEDIFKKRDRYKTLLRFIYKEGNVGIDEMIIGKAQLTTLVSERSKISNASKFVENFLNDIEYLGVIKMNGNRRYTAVSFEEALSKIDKFDDTLRLLENLK